MQKILTQMSYDGITAYGAFDVVLWVNATGIQTIRFLGFTDDATGEIYAPDDRGYPAEPTAEEVDAYFTQYQVAKEISNDNEVRDELTR